MSHLTIDDLKTDAELQRVGRELLWQLADDDLIIGFRDQEWLGLAPHIEEDVAFGSIAQEEIGHAAHYYGLLEQLGAGRADDCASLRTAAERRNSVLLEQPNGPGHYFESPHYDWAFTIVRHYLHDCWEMTLLSRLQEGIWVELRNASHKILAEKRYHRAHQELWMRTMAGADPASRERLQAGVTAVERWMGDLADFGAVQPALETSAIVPRAGNLLDQFYSEVTALLGKFGLTLKIGGAALNGRLGQHTAALDTALATLSEVYRLDPNAQW
jgi:ring-1,2-phenylacetyl-CoA epoxidase subunit PaaC